MHAIRSAFLAALFLGCSAPALAVTPDKADMAAFADQQLASLYAADGPGAAVLIAVGDEVLHSGARGMASLEHGVTLGPQHAFRIGSVTKQFAAAGLLQLVDAGKLGLDDKLSTYLPEFPNGDAISIRQLLDHSSGIKSYTGIDGWMATTVRLDLSTAALIDRFKDQPVDFAPGANWAYNNSAYVLVGAVIETVSGLDWHEHIRQTLLVPAGLQQTGYGANERVIPGMADGYSVRDGAPSRAAILSMTQPHAAGALVSTVSDLHRWNLALHGGKLLSPASYTAMTTPSGPAAAEGFGFGIVRGSLRGREMLSHGGGINGYLSFLLYVPSTGLTVAVLQNADALVNGNGSPQRLATLLGAYALGDPYPDFTPVDVPEEALRSAEGVYRIDEQSARVLRVVDGSLTAQRTGGTRFPLIALGDDRYGYGNSFTWFALERDESGKVTGMRFFAEGEGPGVVVPRSDEPLPADRSGVDLPLEQLQRIEGSYLSGPMRMRVFLDGTQLKVQLDGQPAFDLFAESPSRFFLTVVDARLEFAPETGTPSQLTLHQGGQVIEFQRTD